MPSVASIESSSQKEAPPSFHHMSPSSAQVMRLPNHEWASSCDMVCWHSAMELATQADVRLMLLMCSMEPMVVAQ